MPTITLTGQPAQDERIKHKVWTEIPFGLNSFLVAPQNGQVLLIGNVEWESSDTGQRRVRLLKNGANAGSGDRRRAAHRSDCSCVSKPIDVMAGDKLSIVVWQNTGGNLDVTTGSNLSIVYL